MNCISRLYVFHSWIHQKLSSRAADSGHRKHRPVWHWVLIQEKTEAACEAGKGVSHNCCRSVCIAHCRLVAGTVSGKHHPNKALGRVENWPWASGCGKLGKPIQALIFVFRLLGLNPEDHSPGAPPELASWEAHLSGGLLRASWNCGDNVTSHFSPQTQQQSLLCLLLSYFLKCLMSVPLSHWNTPPPTHSLFVVGYRMCVMWMCVWKEWGAGNPFVASSVVWSVHT